VTKRLRWATPVGARDPLPPTPSLSLGYLAALPLFVAYELGQALADPLARDSSERLMTRLLSVVEAVIAWPQPWLRAALLVLLAVGAWVRVERTGAAGERSLSQALGRTLLEGVLAGILLGPLLMGLEAWLGAGSPSLGLPPERSLAATLRLLGAAPWEELLFRVGLYGSAYLGARQVASFLGLETRLARLQAEFAALLLSSLLFAAFHLSAVQGLLGRDGEPFHRGLFLWRVAAGIVLGGLFRWRGFGTASWCHAVFNLGIALGIRP